MEFLEHYVLAAVVFLVIDSLWIGVVANKFYKSQLQDLLRDKPKFGPAALFYVISVAGIVVFAINPALGEASIGYALGHGALLGLASYAAYDLTNASTLKGWSNKVTVVDLAWGTIVTAAVSVISFLILN